jgi:hypothetical protein
MLGMTREEARQKQEDAGRAGAAVVGMPLAEAVKKLQEEGFRTLVDYQDGEAKNTMAAMQLTIGRVRLQVEDGGVIGYAVG